MRFPLRIALFLAAFAFMAIPANAQDLTFSQEPTLACLDAGGSEECIGRAADVCIDTPDGYTTVGMGFCFDAERQVWDARLNAAYQALLVREAAAEEEMRRIGATVPPTVAPLREMQRAWIPFRDAACHYERAQWGGGTGQGPATAACLMQETGRQALRLEARLAEFEER
ncbi:lysozyme inhibitor LprI family protein [Rhodophyticola sp. MJ-SS7]|nr:lysozyme inhibitor LprI family protein [Rhodophyticola sp. MJ-SS7]